MEKQELLLFGASQITIEVGAWAVRNGWDTTLIANSVQMNKSLNELTNKEEAEAKGIKTVTIEKAAEIKQLALNINSGKVLFISVGSPWIFNNTILKHFNHRMLNLHGTRLPKDRGGTLFSWHILTGQKTGMCLLHQMTKGIDDGPIIKYEEFIYPACCRLPKDYAEVYDQKNIGFLINFIANYKQEIIPQVQPEYLSSYWPRLRADVHGWINWDWDFVEIERQICAFDEPYGGARCRFQDKIVIVRNAWGQSTDGYTHPFQHGLVYRNNGKWISVAARGGELLICSIKDEKGNDLLPFIKPGDRLFTYTEDLMQTKKRVIKSANGLKIQGE